MEQKNDVSVSLHHLIFNFTKDFTRSEFCVGIFPGYTGMLKGNKD